MAEAAERLMSVEAFLAWDDGTDRRAHARCRCATPDRGGSLAFDPGPGSRPKGRYMTLEGALPLEALYLGL